MNIVQLNDILGTVCMKVPTVHSYYGEDIYEAWNTTEVKYASMAFNLENTRQTDHTRTFEGVLYFADRLTEDKSNCLGIYADADNAIANVLTNLQDATDEGEFSISEYQIVHFQQKFADFLAGGYARIQITVANTCDIVLLTEKVSTIIILEENGEYDVSSYSTAIVAVPPYGEEHDPIFCASAAYTIEATDIRLWNYTADYLNSYVSKSELVHCGYITNADLPDYSNTYQAKGNYVTPEIMSAASYVTHDYLSAQAYLTQETDPVFSASIAAGITQSDIDYWNRGGSIDLSSYVSYQYLSAQAYVTYPTMTNHTKQYILTPFDGDSARVWEWRPTFGGLDYQTDQWSRAKIWPSTRLTQEELTNPDNRAYWVSLGTVQDYVSLCSYITYQDLIDELVERDYITAADLPDYSNTYQAKGDYVTQTQLDNAAYITNADLPDYSNTYQAKGDYVTPTDLNNAAYITAADLPDYSNTYQAKGDYVTQATLTAQSYVTQTSLSANAYITPATLTAQSYVNSDSLTIVLSPIYQELLSLNNNKQNKGDYVTYELLAAQSYVTQTTLSAQAYITAADLPDYSNTYQAKGDYITPAILSAQSYLTQETDPVFSASVAATITQSDIDNWNRGGSIDLSSYVTYQYLSAQSYATNARLSEVELVSTKAISYVYDKVKTIIVPDLSAYVSKTELTAQSYVTQTSLSANAYITPATLSAQSYVKSAQFVFDSSTATLHITI